MQRFMLLTGFWMCVFLFHAHADMAILQQGVSGYLGCQDARIIGESKDQNTNWGSHEALPVGNFSSIRPVRSLIRWDLSSLPANSQIHSAELMLYCNEVPDSTPRTIRAFRLLRNWTEGNTIGGRNVACSWTYSNFPTKWNLPGAGMGDEFAGEDSTADRRFIEEAAVVVSRKDKWYSWELTKAVQHWVNGSWKNYGVILISDTEANTKSYKHFMSSEAVDVPHRPELVIRYALAVEPSGKLATTWGQIRNKLTGP
jgi:hypothetical protein